MSKKAVTLIVLAGLYIALMVAIKMFPLPPEDQTQIAERKAAFIEQTKRTERIQLLCKIRIMCSDYGDARQKCAAAGDFDRCMQVKMDDYGAYQTECQNDGSISRPEPDAPTLARCAMSAVNNYLK